jgi:hypothetical protein
MSEKTKITPAFKEIAFLDLVAKTSDSEGQRETYSNHAQVSITNSEILLDFYYVKQNQKGALQTVRVQRMILPHSLGKGLTNALANIIAIYEEENGVALPSSRPKQPEDKIEIWPS